MMSSLTLSHTDRTCKICKKTDVMSVDAEDQRQFVCASCGSRYMELHDLLENVGYSVLKKLLSK